MKRSLLLLFLSLSSLARPLTDHTGAVLVEHPDNTASAFRVRVGEVEYPVRLFFIEAPHPSPTGEAALSRAAALQHHFAIPDPEVLRNAGGRAYAVVRERTSEPFTLHLPATAQPGQDTYGFVTDSNGIDLSAYLVRAGHARVQGPGHDMPRGIREQEMRLLLEDAEGAAMLERAGIWAHADAVRLPGMRARYRRALEEADAEAPPPATLPPSGPINVNTADLESLLTLPGVDEMLAGRIIRGRPYRVPHDLLDVRGIGENLLLSWDGMVTTR